MKLPDKVYDILAFIGRTLLPAIALAYGNLADVWHLPLKSEIVQTIGIVATLILNIFLQEVSKNYNANKVAQVIEEANQGTYVDLDEQFKNGGIG